MALALHHRVDGPADAPVVVLGPSLGTDLQLFDAQVEALAPTFRVVRFDLPGHGGSPEPAGALDVADLANGVVALLDGLGIERFHYAGVSLGGAIGQQLALDHGDRLTSLTLIATAAQFPDPPSWGTRAATVREQGTEAMVATRPGTWFTARLSDERPDEASRLITMLRATTDEGYAACCAAVGTFDVRDRLGEITVPTLVIAGADDPATSPELMRALAGGIPTASFLVVPRTAHLPNAEDPKAINEALLAHLS